MFSNGNFPCWLERNVQEQHCSLSWSPRAGIPNTYSAVINAEKKYSSYPHCATYHPLKNPETELKLTTKSLDIPTDVYSLPFAAGTASIRLRRAPPPATRRLATSRRRAPRSESSAGTIPSAHLTATPTLSASEEEARVGVSEKRVACPLSPRITYIRGVASLSAETRSLKWTGRYRMFCFIFCS